MDILKECDSAKRIGISGHVRPDGDCVGACLALYMYLQKCIPEVVIKVFLEKPSDLFCEIKGFDGINSSFPEEEIFDVFFALDCSKDRMGDAEVYFDQAKKTINIDHHVSNQGTGDCNYIQPQIGSTCEVLYDLFDIEQLDADLAKALYIGMIHDTGVFQYSNTTPETLRKAANLIQFGFDFPRLIEETFYQKTYLQTQIMGRVLVDSIRLLDDRCIVAVAEQEMIDQYQAISQDFEGIVNQLRNVKGIDCAIFMHATNDGEYKVSMRSNEKVDVAKIASHFGGGGHVRAAGCALKGTFQECLKQVIPLVEEQLC